MKKITISLPEPLFKSVDAAAKKQHISRSRFFAVAVRRYLKELRREDITDRLNAVYQDEAGSRLPQAFARMQSASRGPKKP